MTEKQDELIRNSDVPNGIDESEGRPLNVSQDNYKDVLEREILRRIKIMESPDYQRVPRFNKTDALFASVLACLMLALILWGGTF